MSKIITDCLVEGYKNNIELLVQQKGSKLSKCVSVHRQNSKRDHYDVIKSVEAAKINLNHRNAETVITATNYERRIVDLESYAWADLIFREDRVRMLADPTSMYAMNAAYALGRKKDTIIMNAATGSTSASKDNAVTTTNLPASRVIDVASKGLTIEKIRKARELFDNANVDPDDEQYIAVTGKQMGDLLKELQDTKVSFHEANMLQALIEGQVDKFLGFKFKRLSADVLPTEGSSSSRKRVVTAWSKSGVILGMGQDITVDIQKRPDRRNAIQVYASMDCGATRISDESVVKIECKDPST